MSKQDDHRPKTEALRRHGSLHPHPELVRDEMFCKDDFFDPQDAVQVKYEMLRRSDTLVVNTVCHHRFWQK